MGSGEWQSCLNYDLYALYEQKERKKFTRFSDHNGSLPRRQPEADLCEDTSATMQVCMVQTGGASAALSEKLTSHEQACFLESSGCFHLSSLSHCRHRVSHQAAAEDLCC